MISSKLTPPPKNRPIVAVGCVVHFDNSGGYSFPMCAAVRWEDGVWVDAFSGLAVYHEGTMRISWWCELPEQHHVFHGEASQQTNQTE